MVRPTDTSAVDFAVTHVKLLDLLTNRYHVGIVRAQGEEALCVEMPATARLCRGQRVRYIVSDGRGLVEKRSMRRACVTSILPEVAGHVSVQLEAVLN